MLDPRRRESTDAHGRAHPGNPERDAIAARARRRGSNEQARSGPSRHGRRRAAVTGKPGHEVGLDNPPRAPQPAAVRPGVPARFTPGFEGQPDAPRHRGRARPCPPCRVRSISVFDVSVEWACPGPPGFSRAPAAIHSRGAPVGEASPARADSRAGTGIGCPAGDTPMMMRGGRGPARPPTVLLVVAVMAVSAGCAARGARPRPFPTPGEPAAVPAPPPPAGAGSPIEPGAGSPVPGLAPPPVLARLLQTALAQRGAPYRPGGADPGGFDCSGFVTWVFGQHGLLLPRTVQELYAAGAPVDPLPPAAADLVFFATDGRGPSHVGIALGDGRFIHAPSRRGVVRIEPLDSRYWAARYLGSRRVWPAAADPPSPDRPRVRR